jgi:hypothetical protein
MIHPTTDGCAGLAMRNTTARLSISKEAKTYAVELLRLVQWHRLKEGLHLEHIGQDCDSTGTTSPKSTHSASVSTENDFQKRSHSATSDQSRARVFHQENGSSREVSPAKIFPSLVKALGWTVSARDSGSNMRASLASYDHGTRSWRTWQLSLTAGLIEWLGTWPKRGMTRNGCLYALPILARPTKGKDSGSWPTPTKSWGKHGIGVSRTGRGRYGKGKREKALSTGQTNIDPGLVEWLQGYPIGWTELGREGMRLSLRSRR